MLPKGVATFLPEAAARKRYVEESILSVFMQWGYEEVITPLFEYLDVIAAGLGEDLIEKGYKFVDRSDGRLILLRPDVTPQIARMVAMLMADTPKPLRLCYRANVFRHEEEHAGRAREIFQIGEELIGLEGPQADAEVIAIAIESLLRLGLVDFKIALGHSEFFRGFLNSLDLSLEVKHRIKTAIARKDSVQLKKILDAGQVPHHQVQAWLAMPHLFGGEEAIKQAQGLSEEPVCQQALVRLREVYELLTSSGWGDYLLVDLSEVRGFDYYTGMVFEVFVKNLGFPVGRGGRYDQLIGKFGKPCPSAGFAFDVEQVQWAWQQSLSGQESFRGSPSFHAAALLLVDSEPTTHRLFRIATTLRKKGFRIVQYACGAKLKEALGYARAIGIQSVAFLTEQDRVLLTDIETGKTQNLRVKVFLSRLSSKSWIRSIKAMPDH